MKRISRPAPASLVLLMFLLLASLAVLAGCGGGDKSNGGEPAVKTEPSEPEKVTEPSGPGEPGESTTPADSTPRSPSDPSERDAVVAAALACARSNNPDLPELEVLSVKLLEGWARVVVVASDRSTDAAAAYLKKEGGEWVVFDFGTGIGPDLYPEAPPELFN